MRTNFYLRGSILLLMVSFIFLSCEEKDEKKQENLNTSDRFYYEYSGRPEQALTYKEVASMLAHYKKTRSNVLKEAMGFEDTRENWYQLDSLKKYLAYVEKLAKDKNIKITGINILSAAYPDDSVKYGKQKNYQTLIFIPTTVRGNGQKASFDPLHSSDGEPKYFDDMLKPFLAYYMDDTGKMKMMKSANAIEGAVGQDDLDSGAGNRTQTAPPF